MYDPKRELPQIIGMLQVEQANPLSRKMQLNVNLPQHNKDETGMMTRSQSVSEKVHARGVPKREREYKATESERHTPNLPQTKLHAVEVTVEC